MARQVGARRGAGEKHCTFQLTIGSSASAKAWGSWSMERLLAGQHWLSKGESGLSRIVSHSRPLTASATQRG